MKNRMEKKLIKEQTNRKVLFSLICLTITALFFFSLSLSIQASESKNGNAISQFEQALDNSSYSDFQKRMVLNTVQEAIDKGISTEDTLSIIKDSVQNEVDPYNIKKFLDTVISAKNDGISEKPLLNKVKEGLAKNVEERLIINVLNQKSENMKIAQNLLAESQIQNGEPEEMIDILADSLTNGVPQSTLAQILKLSSEQGKEWSEVEDVTKELANLGLKAIEMGIGSDKVESIFNQALEVENNLENICMNIQDLIVAAIAVQVTSSSLQRDTMVEGTSSSSSIPGLPSSSSGSAISGSGSSAPSGETGSSPISSGGDDTTDNESGSSPFN
ncbi:MAG: hypothetical protein PHD84_09510 [Atribacterota bacterium]|nr:hypothetical protein [Atribacterota bacterium]